MSFLVASNSFSKKKLSKHGTILDSFAISRKGSDDILCNETFMIIPVVHYLKRYIMYLGIAVQNRYCRRWPKESWAVEVTVCSILEELTCLFPQDSFDVNLVPRAFLRQGGPNRPLLGIEKPWERC